MSEDRICVAARVRPLSAQEEESGEWIVVSVQDSQTVAILCPAAGSSTQAATGQSYGGAFPGNSCRDPSQRGIFGIPAADGGNGRETAGSATAFSFDAAFDSPAGMDGDSMQEHLYEQIGRPVLQNALCGINGCLFAYGQTGSGKTFSLFGTAEVPGVVPRLAAELLEIKHTAEQNEEEVSIQAAFLELYNENLVDLLSEAREPLRLFENSQDGVVVPGLSESEVASAEEFSSLLDFATQNRSVGATCLNLHSSRSHALIQLRVELRSQDCTKRAKIHLIDLAGSERQKRARNEGARMKEGIHINVSLSALGLVISRLSEIAQGRNHCSVPFRDSKLTFLLKDSLAGNARTQVLIALSPAASNYEESLSSLRFAQSVKRIRTRPIADIVKASNGAQEVQALQSEVARLQAELEAMRAGMHHISGVAAVGLRAVGISGCDELSGNGDCASTAVGSASPVDCGSAGGHSGPSGDGDSAAQNLTTGGFGTPVEHQYTSVNGGFASHMDPIQNLQGTYRSPSGTSIEVSRDGVVRFLGSDHHPICIYLVSVDETEPLDQAVYACSPGQGICTLVLQAEGNTNYRYTLVAEDDTGIVWRHDPLKVGGADDGQLEVRWERAPSSGNGISQFAGAPQFGARSLPLLGLTAPAGPVGGSGPVDARVAQALHALQFASSESQTLANVSDAIPSLACSLDPAAATQVLEALVTLCADLDEANVMLARNAELGIASSVGLGRSRMEATWLAPEPNQEMSARELLRVKVAWQEGGRRPPHIAQVWSVFEFERWLDAMRSSAASADPPPLPAGLLDAGLLDDVATPTRQRRPSENDLNKSSSIPYVAGCLDTPDHDLERSPGPLFSRLGGVPRSPSPSAVPRPSPSPMPMPRGLESARSLPHDLHDPRILHSTPPHQPNGRVQPPSVAFHTPGRGGAHERPQSADPREGGRALGRERANRQQQRSPTPSSFGARRRSASAATVRTAKLGVAAGPGDPCVAARAFDKNSLRLRNGRVFVDALDAWRGANAYRPSAPTRRLQPGMCAVFVRKRPMFDRDKERCDFDVLTVIRAGEGLPIGPEIVHHACMFDRSMVTPFICHTQFPFDGVFDAEASNEDVYCDVGRPLLENALNGNLATLFVFGQTGSGKTYTMRAIERMAVEELFSRLDADGGEVALTYFELAGRKALDLLTDQKSEIRLREEEDGCFRPHDCEEAVVTTAEDMLRFMAEAADRRATDATTVNASSSRSHSVCRITISRPRQAVGRLLLVDCAGTERSRDTLYFKGQHVKESAGINSSLFALKDCIRFRQAALNRQRGLPQEGHMLRLPSVRATPLTKVLAESLINPSAQLAAIATVSPNATDAEHTIDTLRTVYTLSGRGEGRVLEVRQVLE